MQIQSEDGKMTWWERNLVNNNKGEKELLFKDGRNEKEP